MKSDLAKKVAAEAALEYVRGHEVIGVGTGSTTNYFIEALASLHSQIEATVASSIETERRLRAVGLPVQDLNYVGRIPVYVDGADEFNGRCQLIKGGGGALTREKIIAAASNEFICITHAEKQVDVLGDFPLPVEVIPMARGLVARQLVKLGGSPEYREGFVTDNGNIILDIYGLSLVDPVEMERTINNITGVVTNGIFAVRPADRVLVADGQRVKVYTSSHDS